LNGKALICSSFLSSSSSSSPSHQSYHILSKASLIFFISSSILKIFLFSLTLLASSFVSFVNADGFQILARTIQSGLAKSQDDV